MLNSDNKAKPWRVDTADPCAHKPQIGKLQLKIQGLVSRTLLRCVLHQQVDQAIAVS